MDHNCCGLEKVGLLVMGGLVVYAVYNFVTRHFAEKQLQRWNNTAKDVVVIHGFAPATTIPQPSPFIFKLLTFCRMANIPYVIDLTDPFGPKGKAPWISLNGQHVADSEFIIQFLKKKFEVNLDKNYTKEQLSLATVIRILLDEHFIWGHMLERFVFGGFKHIETFISSRMLFIIKHLVKRKTQTAAWYQGIGRHSEAEIVQIMSQDLKLVSTLLGNKKYICGDEPWEQDCGIFAHLAECVWGLQNSPYEKLVNNEELSNVKEYCVRMRERFWPDWNECLRK